MPGMSPNDLLERCGFVHDPACAENETTGAGPGRRMTFEPAWGREDASITLVIEPRDGRDFHEATVHGVTGGPFVFGTYDPTDLAVLAVALQNTLCEGGDGPSAARMSGPAGPVTNPFAKEDGSWNSVLGADRRRHLDHPAGRWGLAYHRFRDELAAQFMGRPAEARAIEYLAAAGFAEVEGGLKLVSLPMRSFEHEDAAVRDEALTFTVVDADKGGVPTDGTRLFEVRSSSEADGILDIVYRAGDVRDVLAFVDACNNAVIANHGYQAPERTSFAHEWSGMAIHNPFGEASYGDWNVVEQGDGRIVVADPWTVWGFEYIAWRDERASDVLAARAQPQDGTTPRP
jgi:hypothetical protein